MAQYDVVREETGESYFPINPITRLPINLSGVDLMLTAEQVRSFAEDRAKMVRSALPLIWGSLIVGGVAVQRTVSTASWIDIWSVVLILVIGSWGIPWVVGWRRHEEGWRMVKDRHQGVTARTLTPSEGRGVAVKTSPLPIRRGEEEVVDEDHERLMIMLRYVLFRCYHKTTSMPRSSDKPYEVIPIVNQLLTPNRYSLLIAVLEELGLVTRAKQRERRDVVVRDYEEARRRLDGYSHRIRVTDFASIKKRAEEIRL